METKPQIHKVPATRVYVPEEDILSLQKTFGEILRSGQFTLGKYNAAFEAAFASQLDLPYAIAVNSGTSALEVVLRSLGMADEEIIIPTNTFAATAFAVLHSGNRIRLADIGEDLCMSREALEASVTGRTRAVILVHIGGAVAQDTASISEFCHERGILLVEDAAHAHGSTLDGRQAGTFGVASAFSFYPTKVITSGEGGMIVTSDASLVATAKILRDQGKEGFNTNFHVALGNNWRLSEFHAALGLSQLGRLEEFISRRRSTAQLYDRRLESLSRIRPLKQRTGSRSNYYKYVALLDAGIDRVRFKAKLRDDCGVSLGGEVYEVPLHRQPVFQKLGLGEGATFDVADDLCSRHVCLPISAVMSEADVDRVLESLRQVVA